MLTIRLAALRLAVATLAVHIVRKIVRRCGWFHWLTIQPRLELRPLPGVGVNVHGLSAAEISELDIDAPELRILAAALEEHSLLWMHSEKSPLSPAQHRALYLKLHAVRFPRVPVAPPPSRPPPQPVASSGGPNLRGHAFPGFAESNVLGYAEVVTNWHGLSGYLEPTAWWEKESGQFHHDGGFSRTAPPPPALVAMSCEEAPTDGTECSCTDLHWAETAEDAPSRAAQLVCPPGSTLFFSTRLPLQLHGVSGPVSARARRIRCCYTSGFGRVEVGAYPMMTKSLLTPLRPPSAADGAEVPRKPAAQRQPAHRSITEFESFEGLAFGEEGSDDATRGDDTYRHPLVQRDARGREYVVVHAVCLDHLEERADGELADATGDGEGCWRPLPWADSQALLEELLAPAARPPHLLLVDWRAGDVVLFDNLQTQHSVTPTAAYSVKGARRLMTRTAMQPAVDVLNPEK